MGHPEVGRVHPLAAGLLLAVSAVGACARDAGDDARRADLGARLTRLEQREVEDSARMAAAALAHTDSAAITPAGHGPYSVVRMDRDAAGACVFIGRTADDVAATVRVTRRGAVLAARSGGGGCP